MLSLCNLLCDRIYFCRQPLLITTDKEMIKEVLVKQFNNFSTRQFAAYPLVQDIAKHTLFFANGAAWRRYRQLMTPAFTSGKLKALLGYMDKCSRTLLDVLTEKDKSGQDVDLKDTFSRFTVDVIAGTEFGTDTNAQQGRQEEQQQLVKAMNDVLSNLSLSSAAVLLAGIFPVLSAPLRFLGHTLFPKKPVAFFKSTLEGIIRQRDQDPTNAQKHVDFLQQMLAFRVKKGQVVAAGTDGPVNTSKHLTEDEVLSQGFIVFIAGYETTSSTLRYLTYSLATNPDVQENLFNEIHDVVGDGDVTYEQLSKMTYLDSVIAETLRMYPPVSFVAREAAETVTIKGVTIPKGAGVLVPIYTTLHNPDCFPEPQKFCPERFLQDQDNLLSALPFGLGPRQCIGMRLAFLEIKTAVVHMFRKFKVVPCDKTPNLYSQPVKA
nr:hypothetical protein BaRGS_021182 [Batillaria attramentaria]